MQKMSNQKFTKHKKLIHVYVLLRFKLVNIKN